MPQYRQIQLVAIVLVLAAGFLWSQRLAGHELEASKLQITDSSAEQLLIVEQKVAEKDNPFELLDFGRKFLSAGNPRFALVPLRRATKLQPKLRDGWYLLGYSYAQLAKESDDESEAAKAVADAVEALETARALDPSHKLTNELLEQLRP